MIRIPALRAFLGFALATLSFIAPAPAAAAPLTSSHYVDVDLKGWKTVGFIGNPLNSELLLEVGTGNKVLGFDYFNLSFATQGASILSELVLSVASWSNFDDFMEWQPSPRSVSGSETGLSGSFGGAVGDGFGAPFEVSDGLVLVSVWDTFDHGGRNGIDALISSGTLRVYLANQVPEPGSYALAGLGLFALSAWSRRRAKR